MTRSYNLDTTAAKEANASGKRITETGKYQGEITNAFYEENKNGTEIVSVMFVSDDGRECGPLPMYTHNGKGEQIAGYKTFNALMTCCKIKAVTFKPSTVNLWDYDEKAMKDKQKDCSPELKGKKIGLVLQQEEYQKGDGSIGERMILAAPFEHGTEMMAMEILGKAREASSLGGFMAFIAKNPIRKLRGQPVQQSRPIDDGSDDINFDDIPDFD